MTDRRVLARDAVIVDVDAEIGSVAKDRLKLGGDRGIIGAGEGRRSNGGRRRGGK